MRDEQASYNQEESYEQVQETNQRVSNLGGNLSETQELPFDEDYVSLFETFENLLNQSIEYNPTLTIGTSASTMLPQTTNASSLLSTSETLNEFMYNPDMRYVFK